MAKLSYTSKITKVRFSLSGSETALQDSNVRVTSFDLFRNNAPFVGGVYDAHLGTIDHGYRCQTCFNNKKNCLGHEGHIDLNYPVFNPTSFGDLKRWIKLICFNCGEAILPASQFARILRSERLAEASKQARSSVKKCQNCGEAHPLVKRDAKEPFVMIAEWYEDKRKSREQRLYPHIVRQIVDRISDDTVIAFGKHAVSHPRNFVLDRIKVSPVTIRPDVRKMGGGKSAIDDLTAMTQVIIKKNDMLPQIIPDVIELKLEKSIYELCNAYNDLIKARGEGAPLSLSARLRGKKGRFRKNIMGKRAFQMCRSTITGNPYLMIDQVGVPLNFARVVQYEEMVQEYNKQRLLTYVFNGRAQYPGCTKIVKRSTGAEYNVENMRDIELENGDIIFRDMITGDPVNFNRQPTLLLSNITTMRAVVLLDPELLTLQMNVLVTPFFSADFDGDQMTLIVNSNVASRNEIAQISRAENMFISHTSGSPNIGLIEDANVGSWCLTRSGIKYNPYHAMLLFQNVTFLPERMEFDDGEHISGRDLMSELLRETPVSLTRATEWYREQLSAYIAYKDDEKTVRINRGRITSGVLDKKTVGKGANGGLFHTIAREYGSGRALEVMYNMQQMAIGHTMQEGFTIGVYDLVVSEKSRLEIDKISADLVNQSRLITDKLNSGEIVPSIGRTVEDFYEEQQINALASFDDYTDAIMTAINPEVNNLFKLIATGSKGKIENMYGIIGSIGQKTINGARPDQKFSFKRSLAYTRRFDDDPISRGHITVSFLDGMTMLNYIANAAAARFDLISKALSTSITGAQNRDSIKNFETIRVDNFRRSMKNNNAIQISFGENYIDPRNLESVKIPGMSMGDREFEMIFRHEKYPKQYELMLADRNRYRDIYFRLERFNGREMFSDSRKLPVNVQRTVEKWRASIGKTTMEASESVTETAKALDSLVKIVDDFCDKLPYVLINEVQERRGGVIPTYMRTATWLMTVSIRAHLHPNALFAMGATPELLAAILGEIRLRYLRSLIEPGTAAGIIAAQSFSEPMTQYMLDAHHRSVTGGTSKSGMTHAKEVLGARDVHRLKSPSMMIPLRENIDGDKNPVRIQDVANVIEITKLVQFVRAWQIFFEKYGEPVHPSYVGESAMFVEFARLNPLIRVPVDLIRWCMRMTLDKSQMIIRNMSIETIVTRLRELYPDIYVVYSPENAREIVLRVYFRTVMFKQGIVLADVKTVCTGLLATIIRGVDRIDGAEVVKRPASIMNELGAIVKSDRQYIQTNGTNLAGILVNPLVDAYNVQTDAIKEMERVFGIEAARQKIISELQSIVDVCDTAHYLIYADEMTFTGRVTSVEHGGLSAREASSVLLVAGFSNPIRTLEGAALNSAEDTIGGVTAPLMVGTVPRFGTLYNRFVMNGDFIKQNVVSADQWVDEL